MPSRKEQENLRQSGAQVTADEQRPVCKMSFMASQGKATQGKVSSRDNGPKGFLDGQGVLTSPC